ncbi:unnamed protein product [Symbiodinium natans]|uniref:Uncharacterized protein n=1 Tax=Symbiodinium natans TaxID=878477 RepID=A0A812U635_9DINO|nr:unnamed protein product [Symbiodinium natans]
MQMESSAVPPDECPDCKTQSAELGGRGGRGMVFHAPMPRGRITIAAAISSCERGWFLSVRPGPRTLLPCYEHCSNAQACSGNWRFSCWGGCRLRTECVGFVVLIGQNSHSVGEF